MSDKIPGRNEPCHCGSGKKYKACHLGADEAKAREARAKAEAEAPVEPPAPEPTAAERKAAEHKKHGGGPQPWKRGPAVAARTFQAPRRSGSS
ncbi:MAG: SEC-C metal-binding domain-containing protein [Vicinamibacteria bacterium]|nr:SEC-C metal-binding domain-containing protein [Vicinamibacteria bacterium]